MKGHDGPGLLTWEADFFNLVEGYFQSFLHIYISDPALCWLFIYLFYFFLLLFFFWGGGGVAGGGVGGAVIQINLKHFDGWSIQ